MATLICTVGLPRSGKTTWARQQPHPIVNPDSVRLSVYGRRFWKPGERQVWSMVWIVVRSLFLAGHETIILDATNTTRKRRKECICEGNDFADPALLMWDTKFKHIKTSVERCLERAVSENDHQIIPIIKSMDSKFEPLVDDEQQVG